MSNERRQRALWALLVLGLAGLAIAALVHGPDKRLAGGARERAAIAGGVGGGSVEADSPLSELANYGQVPDFTLVSQTGDTVRTADLRGRPWIGDFIFTNCASSCPMMAAQLQKLAAALGDVETVRFVSFSVDPERDTQAKLAEYARGYGARPERWLFLTGDKAAVRRLAVDGFHVPAGDATPADIAAGAEPVLHSTRFALVDAEGRIRGYYDGTDAAAVQRLGADLRRLLSGDAS